MIRLLARVLPLLGVNAVPVWGLVAARWTGGTALTLYWLESALAAILVAVRIALHRAMTRKAGHGFVSPIQDGSPGKRTPGSFFGHFVGAAAAFTAGHGIFLAVVLALARRRGEAEALVDLAALRAALPFVIVFLSLGFAIDLIGLRNRPFVWIERVAQRSLARYVVIQATLMLGMAFVVSSSQPRRLFLVFAVLKTLSDFAAWIPQYEPDEAPAWLARTLDRIGKRRGEGFAAYWKRTRREEQRRIEENERVR